MPQSPQSSPNALSLAHRVLRILIVLNVAMGVFILAMLVMSLVAKTWFFTALGALRPTTKESLLLGMRAIMVLGFAAVPLTHVVLARLLAMVETVRAGNPFIADNAARLQ